MKPLVAVALVLVGVGLACVSFDLDDRRFRCDGVTNTCDPGYACSQSGYCEVLVLADASTGDVLANDGATGELCTNMIDDDNDGYIDCADAECPDVNMCGIGCTCPDGDGTPKEIACADGADNDRDGFTDCLDSDCELAGGGQCPGGNVCCPNDGACRMSLSMCES